MEPGCLRVTRPMAPSTSLTRKLATVFDRLLVPSIAPCPIGKLLAETDAESATNLRLALEMSVAELPNTKIRRALMEEAKFATSAETISDHRKGVCRCTNH